MNEAFKIPKINRFFPRLDSLFPADFDQKYPPKWFKEVLYDTVKTKNLKLFPICWQEMTRISCDSFYGSYRHEALWFFLDS